jgi:hypothetical protein
MEAINHSFGYASVSIVTTFAKEIEIMANTLLFYQV